MGIDGAVTMDHRTLTVSQGKKARAYDVSSLKELVHVARELAYKLQGGDVIALQGNLGAGKTTFTQLLAKELGIRNRVTSPTFVMMNLYVVRNKESRLNGVRHLCHIDAYRVENTEGLRAIGAEEYIGKHDTITAIEWAERVKSIIPCKALWIRIDHKID